MSTVRTHRTRPNTLPKNVLMDEEIALDVDIEMTEHETIIRVPRGYADAVLNEKGGPQVRFASANKRVETSRGIRYYAADTGRAVDTPFGPVNLVLGLDFAGWLSKEDFDAATSRTTQRTVTDSPNRTESESP